MTSIDQRDHSVITFVARFKQLTTTQINELAFADLSSPMPCHRTLHRLLDRAYVVRLEHRLVGGQRGGSGQYVYQLGREGHRQFSEGKYAPWTTISLHTLAIADAYLAVVRLERAGVLTINEYQTEPDCHEATGRYQLKPDLYLDTTRVVNGERLLVWFEVDRGTERPIRIRTKLERYWNAFNETTTEKWPHWPVIVWLAHSDERAEELRKILAQGPKEAKSMFRVMTLDDFIASF